MDKGDDPYKIVQKVGDNAYKFELSGDMNIFVTFNVRGLSSYIEDEDDGNEDLRENPLQGGRLMQSKSNNPTSSITLKP